MLGRMPFAFLFTLPFLHGGSAGRRVDRGMESRHALAIDNVLVDVLERRALVWVNRDGAQGVMKHDPI